MNETNEVICNKIKLKDVSAFAHRVDNNNDVVYYMPPTILPNHKLTLELNNRFSHASYGNQEKIPKNNVIMQQKICHACRQQLKFNYLLNF